MRFLIFSAVLVLCLSVASSVNKRSHTFIRSKLQKEGWNKGWHVIREVVDADENDPFVELEAGRWDPLVGLTKSGKILSLKPDGSWRQWPGKAKHLAGVANTVYIIDLSSALKFWNPFAENWKRIGSGITDAAVSDLGEVWAKHPSKLFKYEDYHRSFQIDVKDMAAGKEDFYVVATNGTVFRNRRNQFKEMKFSNAPFEDIERIQVDAYERLWVLDSQGKLYMHHYYDWEFITDHVKLFALGSYRVNNKPIVHIVRSPELATENLEEEGKESVAF